MMSAVLMDRMSFMSQISKIIPIIAFTIIGVAFMVWASSKVALKGEK